MAWMAEVKLDPGKKDTYEEALGQVSNRAEKLFGMQPGRSYFIAAVLGPDVIEVISFPGPAGDGRIRRTGKLPLRAPPSSPTTAPGVLMLLRLFHSSLPLHFNYLEPSTPASFSTALRSDGSPHQLDSFTCMRLLRSQRGASVYSAKLEGSEAKVVLKFSESIQQEVGGLHLHHLSSVLHNDWWHFKRGVVFSTPESCQSRFSRERSRSGVDELGYVVTNMACLPWC